uniref:Putative arginase n=1 Tax=Ixodes ricinus TaxID=34613 RepID=A0A0K8RA64_IXORI
MVSRIPTRSISAIPNVVMPRWSMEYLSYESTSLSAMKAKFSLWTQGCTHSRLGGFVTKGAISCNRNDTGIPWRLPWREGNKNVLVVGRFDIVLSILYSYHHTLGESCTQHPAIKKITCACDAFGTRLLSECQLWIPTMTNLDHLLEIRKYYGDWGFAAQAL